MRHATLVDARLLSGPLFLGNPEQIWHMNAAGTAPEWTNALADLTTIESSGAAALDSGGAGSSFGGTLDLGGALSGVTTIAATDDIVTVGGALVVEGAGGAKSGSDSIYHTAADGMVVFTAQGGSVTDFVLANSVGQTVFDVPAGTRVLKTYSDVIVTATAKLRMDGSSSGNTYFTESASDRVDMVVGGAIIWSATANTLALNATDLVVDAIRKVFFGVGLDTFFTEVSSNVLRGVAGGSGGVDLTSGATQWSAVSDENLKTIIEPITDAVRKVSHIRSVIGRYKDDLEDRRRSFLIAQDFQKVLPESVTVDEDKGFLRLSYTETIPLAFAAINEHTVMIQDLAARVAQLEAAHA